MGMISRSVWHIVSDRALLLCLLWKNRGLNVWMYSD